MTDAVLDEVAAWQGRPLEPVYPLVFFDALRIKIRDEGLVRNKAVYVALGVHADGTKEILGLWLAQNEERQNFWLRVMNELKTRGVEDILVAISRRAEGLPGPSSPSFPKRRFTTAIVHLHRQQPSEFASYKDRKAVAAALKTIYRAIDAASGEAALAAFEASPWGRKYPAIGAELASRLARSRSVLRFPSGRAPIGLYDQRYRGAELKTPQSRSRRKAFSNQ